MLDLLPKVLTLLPSSAVHLVVSSSVMADLLHNAIGAMSIEDEEPLVLPDSPQFTVADVNRSVCWAAFSTHIVNPCLV